MMLTLVATVVFCAVQLTFSQKYFKFQSRWDAAGEREKHVFSEISVWNMMHKLAKNMHIFDVKI